MADLGWSRRRGVKPHSPKGRAQRAGLTPTSGSNTLSCQWETLTQNCSGLSKIPLTVITVSTATIAAMATTCR
jgi:hypothetical protein